MNITIEYSKVRVANRLYWKAEAFQNGKSIRDGFGNTMLVATQNLFSLLADDNEIWITPIDKEDSPCLKR